VPPSLVSSQLCVFAQENSAIHKEKYLWKLKLRVSIANDRGKGSTSCFGNYNYVCLPSQRQRKGYNTSLFSRRLSQAPPPRLSAPTNGMRALPALPYALMFFPCIGDAKRYGAVAFRRGDAIPCVLPPALAPNHHHPPALPQKSGALRERERDGATIRILVAGPSSNPCCFSRTQSWSRVTNGPHTYSNRAPAPHAPIGPQGATRSSDGKAEE
jgi:hypothetical protein